MNKNKSFITIFKIFSWCLHVLRYALWANDKGSFCQRDVVIRVMKVVNQLGVET